MTFAFLVDSVPITKAVRDGETSLGGSESACLGLARALQARGHQIHIFTTKLAEDAAGVDACGVTWHPAEHFGRCTQWIEWDVVVALRMAYWFGARVQARLRLLWNQDLLLPGGGAQIMAIAWQLDHIAYVSDYHRRQWEDLEPALTPLAWVTKNGYDPACVPKTATKDPSRIIHISRPERGLAPILAMWPEMRTRVPHATLQVCRYSSMYDPQGWGSICASYDEEVQRVNAAVGGITYLGELAKPALYKAIAEAAVMWYPGVHDFAETSCIAAIESQANGTPFVGSFKGALPETVPSGILIKGDAMSPEYQEQSIAAVEQMLQECLHHAFAYRKTVKAGKAHVESYTYAVLAEEWEQQIEAWFAERYEQNKLAVMRQLLHEDDHVAARQVAREIVGWHGFFGKTRGTDEEEMIKASRAEHDWPVYDEALKAELFCDRVIAGKEQGPEDYAAHAIQDPLQEIKLSGRIHAIVPRFKDCTHVLDVACGNGAMAIALAQAHPQLRVTGIDYAQPNIDHAKAAAEKVGVGDRCTFLCAPFWDLDQNVPAASPWPSLSDGGPLELDPTTGARRFDGAFIGEFAEHVADVAGLVDFVETFLRDDAVVVYTCPCGPFAELAARGTFLQRGHVHCFKHDDVKAVWGGKKDASGDFLEIGMTPRGSPVGHWIIHYRTAPNRPAGQRDLTHRVRSTRPMPKLSVGLIVLNGELDLARCLTSIWPIADEIVIGDTGSSDDTKAIAAKYGASVIDLDPLPAQPQGFAGARNQVLAACTGDWFLWIDADEQLIDGHFLRHYLDALVFHGFVLHQNHLYVDAAPTFDIPVRLFRRVPEIQFYGCVHEQPQWNDANTDIFPTLAPQDVQIAHTGYLTNGIREEKRAQRNLPLLIRDQQVYPDRLLGKVLILREATIQGDVERARADGAMTLAAQKAYAQALRIFIEHFDDPAHKFHALGRPWYQAALRHMGVGYEIEIAIGGKKGPMNGARPNPERVWVRDAAEFERLMTWKAKAIADKMTAKPLKTDPFDVTPQPVAEVEQVPA